MNRARPDPLLIRRGDCLSLLPEMVRRGGPFDHIITDPPYEDVHHDPCPGLDAGRASIKPDAAARLAPSLPLPEPPVPRAQFGMDPPWAR